MFAVNRLQAVSLTVGARFVLWPLGSAVLPRWGRAEAPEEHRLTASASGTAESSFAGRETSKQKKMLDKNAGRVTPPLKKMYRGVSIGVAANNNCAVPVQQLFGVKTAK